MKYKLIFTLIFVASSVYTADAAKLIFKDGKEIEGEILSQDQNYISFKSGRIPKKYALERIAQIITDLDQAVLQNVSVENTVNLYQFENVSPEKAKKILRFLDVGGVKKSIEENIAHMANNVPESKRPEILELFDINELLASLVPIYDRHYTDEDMDTLSAFFDSSVGRKMQRVTPQVMKETLEYLTEHFKTKMGQ